MSAVNLNNQEWTKSNFNDYIVPKYINAPHTNIQNRSQVLDSSNMLQAVMGVERIPFRSINLLQREFGANGEQVWELELKDARIRFVGGWESRSGTDGSHLRSGVTGDYTEITFYGTGINLLSVVIGASTQWTYNLNNGSTTAIPAFAAPSSVLDGRNYVPNVIIPIISGLTLGTHTIKINNIGTGIRVAGIEILNQSASITIPPGQAFIGNKKDVLAILSTSTYNAGVIGTKGARVVKYLKDGVISQVVTEVPSTPTFFPTVVDHTNEEVVRRINFREFGVNRADDLSTLAGVASNRAFTLDDGTTTLTCSSMQTATLNGFDSLRTGGAGDQYTVITFVGTGLDVFMQNQSTVAADSLQRFNIDGAGDVSLGAYINSARIVKICSGLPYGTHTVQLKGMNGRAADLFIIDFIIYQSKKPILPTGAVEIADYNVAANYSVLTSNLFGGVSSGVLRKAIATREGIYLTPAGTWGNLQIDVGTSCGWLAGTGGGVAGQNLRYTFFGTGCEIQYLKDTSAQTSTIMIDGSSNFAATNASPSTGVGWSSVPTVATYGFNTTTFTANTGTLAVSAGGVTTKNYGVSISGLTLGFHTIILTQTVFSAAFYVQSIDIITPIHINHPSLKIGSLGLLDNNSIQANSLPVSGPDLGKAKAWVAFDHASSKILSSYNISQVLAVSTGVFIVYFSKPFKNVNYIPLSMGTLNTFVQEAVSTTRAIHSITLSVPDYNGVLTNTKTYTAFFGELQEEE